MVFKREAEWFRSGRSGKRKICDRDKTEGILSECAEKTMGFYVVLFNSHTISRCLTGERSREIKRKYRKATRNMRSRCELVSSFIFDSIGGEGTEGEDLGGAKSG